MHVKPVVLALGLGLLLVGSAATPRAAPAVPLALAGMVSERDPQGAVHLIGEVVNQSARSYGRVQVVAFLYGADARVTGVGTSFTLLSVLRPGQRSPVDVNFALGSSGTRYAAIVRGQPVTVGPPTLAVAGLTTRAIGKGSYRVQGWVTNRAPGDARYVEVVATLYGPSGHVAGFGLGTPDSPSVTARKPAHFSITAAAGERVARVVVHVEDVRS